MAKREFEIVYANISTGFEKGRKYANPRFFTTPRAEATRVIVVGEWPKVVEAYQKIGVPVIQLDHGQPLEDAEHADPLDPIDPQGDGGKQDGDEDHDPGTVEIHEDWKDMSWQALRALAKDIDGKKFPLKKDEAIEIIENELKRRNLPPQE